MGLKFDVTVQQFDNYGNYVGETLPVNDAILKLLRFARKNPGATCIIQLREILDVQAAPPVYVGPEPLPSYPIDEKRVTMVPSAPAAADAGKPHLSLRRDSGTPTDGESGL